MIPILVPYWDMDEVNAMSSVLRGNFINEHVQVREFEKEFAKFVGAKYCVMCTSGSMALYMALMAVQPTFPSSMPTRVPTYMGIFVAHALKQAGIMAPRIIDVEENGLTDETASVFYVHANGRVRDDPSIFLEDCCQAIHHHTKGSISCYSFAPTKHMSTGQGGAVCTDDKDVYEELVGVKDHGRKERAQLKPVNNIFTKWGTNLKMTEFQAGFGRAQLKKLPKRLERFQEIYRIYRDELFDHVGFNEEPPMWEIDIKVKHPDKLIRHLRKNGIGCDRVHMPIHMVPEFSDQNLKLPKSERLYDHTIVLPSTTNLLDNHVLEICDKVKEGLKQ